MKVRGDFLRPQHSTDKTTLIIKVSKGAKIRSRYNQVLQVPVIPVWVPYKTLNNIMF